MKFMFKQLGVVVVLALLAVASPVSAQNLSGIKQSARNAVAGIKVATKDGKATVTYKGKSVWTGKVKGRVTGLARTVNGTEYAAAFEGNKVLWENVKGAAKQVK